MWLFWDLCLINYDYPSDATIKVRLAGSEDFFEVELVDIGDSYNSLVTCFAEELDVKSETVAKIRKLPNILIRKDRDVKRIKNGSEFEVELNPESWDFSWDPEEYMGIQKAVLKIKRTAVLVDNETDVSISKHVTLGN